MMSELISRQEAIKATSESLKNIFVDHDDVAQKIINKVPSAGPRWIPMSERNPTVGQDVLVTTRKGKIYVVTYAIKEWRPEHCFRWKPNFMGTEYLDANDVIAWMSLPKPYQEDKR